MDYLFQQEGPCPKGLTFWHICHRLSLIFAFAILVTGTESFAEKIDCEIEDTVIGLKKIAKVYTNPGSFNELYDSTAVSYRITEWKPKMGKPATLLLMIRTPERTTVATGSIRDYVSALEYDEVKPYRRSLTCHPVQ